MRAGTLGEFGDKRRAATGSTLFERVMETGSLVVRRLGGTRAGEMAIHRFLSAPSVTTQEMVETLAHLMYMKTGDEENMKWLEDNEAKLEAFYDWLKAYKWTSR